MTHLNETRSGWSPVGRLPFRFLLLCLLLAGACVGSANGQQGDGPSEVPPRDAVKGAEAQRQEDEEAEANPPANPGTETPADITCGLVLIDPARKGVFKVWTAIPGRTCYNCFAWAFCRNTDWTQPTGISMKDLLAQEGYRLTPVDCLTSTANPLVLILWHVPTPPGPPAPDSLPSDLYIIHGMKRLDGKWSSKNGQSFFYPEVPDPSSFLDTFYPAPPGKTKVVRCFARA